MATDVSQQERLEDCRDVGLMRLEHTIHSSKPLHGCEELVKNTLVMLEDCKSFSASFADQWKALVDEIYNKAVVCIFVNNRYFAYCHWYNAQTGKMQGIQKAIGAKDNIMDIVANFSFNGRPTLLVTYPTVDCKEPKVESFKRTTANITLAPGPKSSLWPNAVTSKLKYSFERMGLVDYKGMNVGWLEKRKHVVLAELAEVAEARLLKSEAADKGGHPKLEIQKLAKQVLMW
ncbi:hypothetical protein BX667DRAFT_507890 [Coemansia mojavensis]|nr:hypothetical protein BX667DRAFT_507890 [Coemansia mojavensis]